MAGRLAATLVVVVAACVLDLGVEAHDQQVVALDTSDVLLQTGTKPATGTRSKVGVVLKRPPVEKPAKPKESEKTAKTATHDALAAAGSKRAKEYVAAHAKDAAEELKQKTLDKNSRERSRKKAQPEGEVKPMADPAQDAAAAKKAALKKQAEAAAKKAETQKADEQAAKKAEKESADEQARKATAKEKVKAAQGPNHNEVQNKASLKHLNDKQTKIEQAEAKMRAQKASDEAHAKTELAAKEEEPKQEEPKQEPKQEEAKQEPKKAAPSLTLEQLAARAELRKAQVLLKAAGPLPKPDPADAKPADAITKDQPPAQKQGADETAKEVAQATKEAAAQNKHIVDLRNTIQQFEQRVQKTLASTEEKIKHNTAAIKAEHNKLQSDSKTLAKIDNLANQAQHIEQKMATPKAVLLQLGETNQTVPVTAPKGELEALLAKKKADLVANLEKLQADVQEKSLKNAEELADKEKAAADKASKAAMTAEQAKVEAKRDAFIKAEVEKAKAAANLKIVNPLEQKLQEAKAEMDNQKQLMDADRERAVKYLQAAQGAAVASDAAPGGDSAVQDDKLSKDDAEADKSSSLLRFSSKQAAEAESKYHAIKMEYDALQTKLEAENKKHMDEAAEKAEEQAGPAFDKAAAEDEKRVAQEAANKAKEGVTRQIGGETCAKCMKACTTQECSAWCQQGKWCANDAATSPTEEGAQDEKAAQEAPQEAAAAAEAPKEVEAPEEKVQAAQQAAQQAAASAEAPAVETSAPAEAPAEAPAKP